MGQEAVLLASLAGHTEEACAAETDNAALAAELEVILAGIEGQGDGDLLTIVEGFAGGFGGCDDE